MAKRVRFLVLPLLLLLLQQVPLHAQAPGGRFDLVGPRIDIRITRAGITLPIAEVPNLQPGDKIWLHPDLPENQSAHYLLICAFLRGSTNPPPDNWFTRIEMWDKKVREEGTFVTVPKDAQQAILFMAPETGGDYSTLRKSVEGRPGVFVRASQDLTEAGFELARTEKYLSLIRRVPPSDPADLQRHSDLLARTLALKPNPDCFKQPVDTQFTCLTQTGTQTLLDDSHAQSVVTSISNGPNSDFINQASTLGAASLYSAYVGAIVDLVRIMGGLHTAQYQYIPAISFPDEEALNLRLNSPPSFRNPKSVLVIGLPSVQAAVPPPLRPADANHVSCLLRPSVTLPIEGAPLVFSAGFAHDMVLHLNVPDGAPAQADIPVIADAFQGGLVLQQTPEHHTELPKPAQISPELKPSEPSVDGKTAEPPVKPQPKPVLLTGTVKGQWGFDSFTGPTLQLQQLPGRDWQIIETTNADPSMGSSLIAGHNESLTITSTGSACVHTITARPTGSSAELTIGFEHIPQPDQPNFLKLSLPLEHEVTPGDLHLAIQQYGQPKADVLSARTFSEPAHITSAAIHAGDRTILLHGANLGEVQALTLGDLNFKPADENATTTLRLDLPSNAPAPPTHANEHLTAKVSLQDGRTLTLPVVVSIARPSLALLSKNIQTTPNQVISLPDANDLPLSEHLTFTLKSATPFPRDGQIEIETLDGTLRTVLTLAPSGGLLLQDPHTIVAALDPQRSFGPSAFGPLHLRALFPTQAVHADPSQPAPEQPASDWLPLATLVRLPDLTLLQCPSDAAQECTLSGSNLFLLQSISTDPTFASPITVPDGFTGNTLNLPHPVAGTVYLHLRDDPNPIDPANVPLSPGTVITAHTHNPKPTTKSSTKPLPPASVTPIPAPDATPTPSNPQPTSDSSAPATNTPAKSN
jgi:hypothetical protein